MCVCVCIYIQRYGLWDNEGPLEEQNPSPDNCKVEGKTKERDEDGKRKGEGGEEDEGRVSPTSTLDNLEITELDQLEQVSANT